MIAQSDIMAPAAAMTPAAVMQTIGATAAWVAKSSPSNDGQRALLFLEDLARSGLDVRGEVALETRRAITSVHGDMNVKRRDLSDLSMLYGASLTDESARRHVEKVRSGEHRTIGAATSSWRREKAEKASKAEKADAKQGRSYMKKTSLSRRNRKLVFTTVAFVKAKTKTNGDRVLTMCETLLELGLARLDQSGGPVSGEKIRRQIEAALEVQAGEIGHGLTILRKKAAGELPEGAIEALKSGRYASCATFLKTFSSQPKKRVEIIKDDEWMRERAREVDRNMLLPSVTAKILAYQQIIADNRVLDPTVKISRRINVVADAAIYVFKCSRSEFVDCWKFVRGIARKQLPASAADALKRGLQTATHMLNEAGGIGNLARAFRADRASVAKCRNRQVDEVEFSVELGVGVESDPTPETVEQSVVIAETVPTSVVISESSDPVRDFRDIVAVACAGTDLIIDRLKKANEAETARAAELFRHDVGLAKMRVSQIMSRKSMTQRHNSRRTK